MFSLTMLGSGSAGNSALVATNHCKILVDGGLSARQLVLRLEQCGVMPERLDGILLTHEHGDHICGLEVLCRKFDVPIYCNALTAEAARCDSPFERHRNWRIFATGSEFSICDITVQTFPVPHDAVDPLGFTLYAGSGALGFITDLGYVTKMIVERLRQVQTLVIETNHDEKLLQNDTHRPWPVKQRIQSRHGHLSNTAAAGVIEELLPGKIERVVLGHLSRDCNTPKLALEAVRASLVKCGRIDVEVHCATQFEVTPQFQIGETNSGAFQPTFENAFFQASLQRLSITAAGYITDCAVLSPVFLRTRRDILCRRIERDAYNSRLRRGKINICVTLPTPGTAGGFENLGGFFDGCALLLWRELDHAPVFVWHTK